MTHETSIENAISRHVDAGELAGAAALVWRRGEVRETVAVGRRDLATGLPVRRDTIFRIASSTKPTIGVAMMILHEEGRWRLDDPVAKHIPEWVNLKVRAKDGSLRIERRLPNGIVFGAKAVASKEAVRMELWLTNGTREKLTDLRVQNCVMLKGAVGFEEQTNDNKIFAREYVAGRSKDGNRWVITAWDPLQERLMSLSSFNPAIRALQRLLVGYADDVEVDAAGRILVPPELRRYANLDKRVVLVGQGHKFELWDEQQWQVETAQAIAFPASNLPPELSGFSL